MEAGTGGRDVNWRRIWSIVWWTAFVAVVIGFIAVAVWDGFYN